MTSKPEFFNFNPSLEKQYCFSTAVRAGDFVFIGGLTASDDEGNELYAEDAGAQMRSVYEQLARVLKKFDGTPSDIVSETIYFNVSAEEYNRDLFPHRQAFYRDANAPSVAGLQVAGFTSAAIKLELTAIAFLPESSSGLRMVSQS